VPLDEYSDDRLDGDCPAMDARYDSLIEEFRKEMRPNIVLMEMISMWNIGRDFALLLELETQSPLAIRRMATRVM
jgi:hypothetical protein